jgi:hypothetical protein
VLRIGRGATRLGQGLLGDSNDTFEPCGQIVKGRVELGGGATVVERYSQQVDRIAVVLEGFEQCAQ